MSKKFLLLLAGAGYRSPPQVDTTPPIITASELSVDEITMRGQRPIGIVVTYEDPA